MADKNIRSLACIGYPEYEVDDEGNVYIAPRERKLLKQERTKSGYRRVTLKGGRRFMVHHLVLIAFAEDRPKRKDCRHLDGTRDNNRLENLRWGTKEENMADKNRHGTDNNGDKNGKAKLTKEQVEKIREMFKTGEYTKCKLGEIFEVSNQNIGWIVREETWRKTDATSI